MKKILAYVIAFLFLVQGIAFASGITGGGGASIGSTSDHQVLFNNGGIIGGNAGLTFNDATGLLSVYNTAGRWGITSEVISSLSTNASSMQAVYGGVTHSGTGNYDSIFGGRFQVYKNAASTSSTGLFGLSADAGMAPMPGTNSVVGNAYALYSGGIGVIAGPGSTVTATNAYGLYLKAPTIMSMGGGVASITNLYGLYIQGQTTGGTKSYNIWSDGASSKVYFGGNIGVGMEPIPYWQMMMNKTIAQTNPGESHGSISSEMIVTGAVPATVTGMAAIGEHRALGGYVYGGNFTAKKTTTGNITDAVGMSATTDVTLLTGTGTASNLYGTVNTIVLNSGTASNIYGDYVSLTANPTNPDYVGKVSMFEGSAMLTGTGNVDYAYGLKVAINHTLGGTLDRSYGVYIDPPSKGSTGPWNYNYGIYISDHSAYGATASYNLYSAGATSKLAHLGYAFFGAVTPSVGGAAHHPFDVAYSKASANDWDEAIGLNVSNTQSGTNGSLFNIGVNAAATSTATGAANWLYGGSFSATMSGASTGGLIYGVQGITSANSNGTTFASNIGGQFTARTTNGTVTAHKGVNISATVSNSATVTSMYGLYVSTPSKAGGATIQNNYGIYIDTQSGHGSTLSYNFYSKGTAGKNLYQGILEGDSSSAMQYMYSTGYGTADYERLFIKFPDAVLANTWSIGNEKGGSATARGFTINTPGSFYLWAAGTLYLSSGQNLSKGILVEQNTNLRSLSDGTMDLGMNSGASLYRWKDYHMSGVGYFWNNADTTNYERAAFSFASNIFTIKSEKGGSGTERPIKLQNSAGTNYLTLDPGGTITMSASNYPVIQGANGVDIDSSGWVSIAGHSSYFRLTAQTGIPFTFINHTSTSTATPSIHHYNTLSGGTVITPTDWERFEIGWNSNVLELKTTNGGGGTARNMKLYPIGGTVDVTGDLVVSGLTDTKVKLTSGSGAQSVTAKNQTVVCTSTCTVTPLTPATGVQLCVRNAPGSATVITLAALGGGNYYELTDHSAYATVNQKLVSGGVASDAICLIGLDSTHYLVTASTGTWTDTP